MSVCRVIFLDIDGVLNSRRTLEAFGFLPRVVNLDSLRFCDPIALAYLRTWNTKYGVKIVLTSTWRNYHRYDLIGQALDLEIYGATPYQSDGRARGFEVEEWLGMNPTVKDYVILDDDLDWMPHQLKHYVRVCRDEGMILADKLQVDSILGLDANIQPKELKEMALLPIEPTEDMWADKKVRVVLQWMQRHPYGTMTVKNLRNDAKMRRAFLPTWAWTLLEQTGEDQVPPVGTISEIIYRLMSEAYKGLPNDRLSQS